MFPILYESTVTSPSGNGFGVLSDCIECKISETLNGEYKLDMIYPLGGLHSDEIEAGRLLYALRDNNGDKQLFRISEVDINYITREMTVYAEHISYDLRNYPIPPVQKKTSAYGWLTYLQTFNYYGATMPFTFDGDITESDTTYTERMERKARTVRGLLLTDSDAIINTYSPAVEFEFDNFDVNFLKARGTDTGIKVRYGKNLTEITSVGAPGLKFYGVVPYYKYTVNDVPQYIIGSIYTDAEYDKDDPTKNAVAMADFTEDIASDLSIDTSVAPTSSQRAAILNQMQMRASVWAVKNASQRLVADGLTIDFKYLDLSQAGEYWTGPTPEEMTADVGDYITVVYDGVVNSRYEIVSVEYDCLKERYNTMTAGKPTATLSETVRGISDGASDNGWPVYETTTNAYTYCDGSAFTTSNCIEVGMFGQLAYCGTVNGGARLSSDLSAETAGYVTVATVPYGYRPARTVSGVALCGVTGYTLAVTTGGDIQLYLSAGVTIPAGYYLSFSVSYIAAYGDETSGETYADVEFGRKYNFANTSVLKTSDCLETGLFGTLAYVNATYAGAQFKNAISGNNSYVTISTLPSGYRPATLTTGVAKVAGELFALRLTTSGDIQLYVGSGVTIAANEWAHFSVAYTVASGDESENARGTLNDFANTNIMQSVNSLECGYFGARAYVGTVTTSTQLSTQIVGTNNWTNIGTLPIGYSPAKQMSNFARVGTAKVALRVLTNGNIEIYTTSGMVLSSGWYVNFNLSFLI